MNSEDTRNLILAIVLSAIVLIGWNYFFAPKPHPTPANQPVAAGTAKPAANSAAAPQTGTASAETVKPRTQALAASPRVKLDAPGIGGSINLQGGEIDDVFLKDYRETVDPNSPNVVLFSPAGSEEPYWAETGFVTADKSVKTPNRETRWTSSSGELTPGHPVTLTYDNGAGLVFTREIAVDDKYMFTVTDSVANKTDKPVSLSPYALVLRRGTPKVAGYSVLHEGFEGYVDGPVCNSIGWNYPCENTYAGIAKAADHAKNMKGVGGWVGFTDKYWGSAVIPGQKQQIEARFSESGPEARPDYQSDFLAAPVEVAPGASASQQTHIFAGAKEVSVIDAYAAQYGIKKFDLMIDWGWFYFITKPLFRLIDFIYHIVGNFGVAILCVTVIIKAVFFPLANQSYRSMAKMKLIQPKIAALKEMYPNDAQKQQQAQMKLMREEGVNPVAGCLPMLIQIPVFFALYKVIFITIEMRQAPFFGWIHDLSAPDPTNIFTLFGLVPWDPTALPVFGHFLHLGIWPLIMGFTMFLQMKMQPEPADPTQKMMFTYMPFIFTFMFGSFPAGLVIYYAWNNTLTVVQQSLIMKRAGIKIELFDNLRKMFVRPAA